MKKWWNNYDRYGEDGARENLVHHLKLIYSSTGNEFYVTPYGSRQVFIFATFEVIYVLIQDFWDLKPSEDVNTAPILKFMSSLQNLHDLIILWVAESWHEAGCPRPLAAHRARPEFEDRVSWCGWDQRRACWSLFLPSRLNPSHEGSLSPWLQTS